MSRLVPVPRGRFYGPDDRVSANSQAGHGRCQTLFRKARTASSNPIPRVINVDKNRVSACGRDTGNRRHAAWAFVCASANTQQCVGTGSSNGKVAGLVGEGLRFVSKCLANIARDRSSQHDSQGKLRWVANGDLLAQAYFIDKLFGLTY